MDLSKFLDAIKRVTYYLKKENGITTIRIDGTKAYSEWLFTSDGRFVQVDHYVK